MKSANLSELKLIVESLQGICGAPLQSISLSEKLCSFLFWKDQEKHFIIYDFRQHPLLIYSLNSRRWKVLKKPLQTFLVTHFKDAVLESVELKANQGRVVSFKFFSDDLREIEFRLFPGGANIIARVGDKQVSLSKPKELATGVSQEELPAERTAEEIYLQWELEQNKKSTQESKSEKSFEKEYQKKISKLKKSISKVEEDLVRKQENIWQKVADELMTCQSVEVKEELKGYIDNEKSFSENIQMAYAKSKSNKEKVKSTFERLQQLKTELTKLEENPELFHKKIESKQSQGWKLKKPVSTRKKMLASGEYALLGKSAKDNLLLLRQAKPWFLWLHLKDVPGAHAILSCSKKGVSSDQELVAVAKWLYDETAGKKQKGSSAGALDVLVAECRYVKPIKGDRLGRVNYSNEKVLRVKV